MSGADNEVSLSGAAIAAADLDDSSARDVDLVNAIKERNWFQRAFNLGGPGWFHDVVELEVAFDSDVIVRNRDDFFLRAYTEAYEVVRASERRASAKHKSNLEIDDAVRSKRISRQSRRARERRKDPLTPLAAPFGLTHSRARATTPAARLIVTPTAPTTTPRPRPDRRRSTTRTLARQHRCRGGPGLPGRRHDLGHCHRARAAAQADPTRQGA